MSSHRPPIDVEPALLVYLEDVADYVDTWIPTDLQDRTKRGEKVLRVKRVGGGMTATSDEPTISILAFAAFDAAAPRAAHHLMQAVTSKVLGIGDLALPILIPVELGGVEPNGTKVTLDSGGYQSGPVELPWPDPTVQVVESIFRISTRR